LISFLEGAILWDLFTSLSMGGILFGVPVASNRIWWVVCIRGGRGGEMVMGLR
jgi:hypothetical protein